MTSSAGAEEHSAEHLARASQKGPTKIYIANASSDVAARAWGGHWNQDVFNACVDLLRQHVNTVARYYHPQGVELVVATGSKKSRGWKATFRTSGSGGYHSFSNGYPMAVASTSSLLLGASPCTVMGEELAEMLGNPKPGSICFTVPNGPRIEPEIVDPVWGSGYCPAGYEPNCADDVAGGMPGFVLPEWFNSKHGVTRLSNDVSFPAGIITKQWQKTSQGEYLMCG